MDASGEDVGVVNDVMDEERFSAHAARGKAARELVSIGE